MNVYCRFFGTILDKDKEIMSIWQPNSRKQGGELVGGVSSSLMTPSSNSPSATWSTHAHIDDSKGQPSKSSRVVVIFSSRQPSSLSLVALLGVPTYINKKASNLSRLAIS